MCGSLSTRLYHTDEWQMGPLVSSGPRPPVSPYGSVCALTRASGERANTQTQTRSPSYSPPCSPPGPAPLSPLLNTQKMQLTHRSRQFAPPPGSCPRPRACPSPAASLTRDEPDSPLSTNKRMPRGACRCSSWTRRQRSAARARPCGTPRPFDREALRARAALRLVVTENSRGVIRPRRSPCAHGGLHAPTAAPTALTPVMRPLPPCPVRRRQALPWSAAGRRGTLRAAA